MIRRVVGLDLSLTGTGIARVTGTPVRFSDPGVEGLHREGRVVVHPNPPTKVDVRRCTSVAPPPGLPRHQELPLRSARLRKLAGEVTTLCSGADLVVVEAPAYSSQTGHMHDRSGLWWLIIARLTANNIAVVEVVTQHLKMYALGKGGGAGTGKDAVLAAVVRRYPDVPVQSNDEADALVLAAMGARRLGLPIEGTLMPQQNLRAMTTVAWPNQ